MVIQIESISHRVHRSIEDERLELGFSGIEGVLDLGSSFALASVLQGGGALVFPHTYLSCCGHQVAACVHALLDSGADQALVLGVLHMATPELREAHSRCRAGALLTEEPTRGVQGPGLAGREDWEGEFSLLNFCFLLDREVKRRGVTPPKLWLRYPFLVGVEPERLGGIGELEGLAKDSAVLATGDLFHHGLAYDTPSDQVFLPDEEGMERARMGIEEACNGLAAGDYVEFIKRSHKACSDWENTGTVMRHLIGPCLPDVLDLAWADTDSYYEEPAPNWVAPALISFTSSDQLAKG